MRIRHAQDADTAELRALTERARSRYPAPQGGSRDPADVLLLAEIDARLVGYLSGALNGEYAGPAQAPPPPHAYVLAVVVEPAARRQGAGTALMNAFLEHAQEAGARWSFLFPEEGPGVHERTKFFSQTGYTPLPEPGEPHPALSRWIDRGTGSV